MVETDLLPVVGDMAAFTILAEAALMGIILTMTAVAIMRRLPVLAAFHMAILALDLGTGMPSGQRKVRPLMIKSFAV